MALERTRVLLAACERLRAAAPNGVRDLDARELYALDGAGSAVSWLRQQRAGGRVAPLGLARRLAGRPAVQAALAAGSLDVPAAERVCGLLAALPETADEATVRVVLVEEVPALLQEIAGGTDPDPAGAAAVLQSCAQADGLVLADRLEPAWVLIAARLPAALVGRVLRHLTDALLPEEHLQRWEDEQARTDLHLRDRLDGYCDVRGLLDPETAAALRASLDARRVAPDLAPAPAEQAQDAADCAPATHAVDAAQDEDCGGARPAADAASTRGSRSAVDGDGDGDGVQLTLVNRPGRPLSPLTFPVLACVDTVLGRPGALPGRYGPGLATSLPLDALRRLGCGAALAAVLLDAHGQPIGASGTHRHATARERRALLASWAGRCATDGCPNPGTVPHHVQPWWLSHHTRLPDLIPCCDHCHHDLHNGHRTLRLRNGRCINPTGWCDPPRRQAA